MKTIWPLLSSFIFMVAFVLWIMELAYPTAVFIWGFISIALWFIWFVRGDWS